MISLEIYNYKENNKFIDSFLGKEKIKEYRKNLRSSIHQILNMEQYQKNSLEKIKNKINKTIKINNNLLNHLNIVVIGKTGVGKSTLINKVFNYDKKNCLEVSIGEPCTKDEPEYKTSENLPFIRLADTRGIEIGQYGAEELFQSINNFIDNKLETKNPDQYVHCIWYCITGTRLEDIEIDTLDRLRSIYVQKKIPLIFVYTRALSDTDIQKMEYYIKNKYSYSYDFIPVLAKEDIIRKMTVQSYGIDQLKEKSFVKAIDGIKPSLFEDLNRQKNKSIEKILNKIEKQLKINKKVDIKGNNDEEICNDFNNLLSDIIFAIIDTEENLSQESKNVINNFLENFIKKSKNDFTNFDIKQKIKNKIKEYLSQDNLDVKSDIIEKLIQDKENVILKNSRITFITKLIKKISIIVIDELIEDNKKIYENIQNGKELQNYIENIVQQNFDIIKKNLKL